MSQIRVELQLEDRSFVSGVRRAGQSLRDFKSELARTNPHFARLQAQGKATIISFRQQEEAARSLGQRLRDVSIIAGGAVLAFRALSGAGNGIIGSVVRVNAELEKLRYQLAGMSNAADPMAQATEQVRELQQLAAETPFSLNEIANSFVKLNAAGLNPTVRTMRTLTDAMAAFGASDIALHRVTIALAQMQGKGVLSMEELRQQLGEHMPSALSMFARSMNMTIGQMVKLISMGVVESSSAIQGFMGELERSYAGTGRFMMQTFSGQMARIRTELTRLATGQTGTGAMGSAFDMLKQKMGDFADFLAGKDAADFFDTVGNSIQRLLENLDILTGTIVRIRDFFAEWGKVILVALGGVAFLSILKGFTTRITSIATAWEGVAAAMRKVRVEKALIRDAQSATARANMATAAAAAASPRNAQGQFISRRAAEEHAAAERQAAAAARANSGWGRVATAVGGVGAGIIGSVAATGGLLLALGAVGLVANEVSNAFGRWRAGIDSANEALNRTVEGQRQTLVAARAAKTQELQAAVEFLEAQQRDEESNIGRPTAQTEAALARARQELATYHAATNDAITAFMDANVGALTQESEERIAAATREISNAYRQTMNELDREFQEQMDTAQARGESVRQVQARFRERRNQERVARQLQLIEARDREINSLRELPVNDHVTQVIYNLIEARDRLREEMEGWSPDDFIGRLVAGVEDEEKKTERLIRTLEQARERFMELQAEINGASGALARLMYRIQRGDFGNFSNATEETIRWRDAMVEATIAAEVLDRVSKGLNEAEAAADRILQNLRRENMRLRAEIAGVDVQNEYELFQWEVDNGEVESMRAAHQVVEEAIANVTRGVDLGDIAFQALGATIRTNAFGEDSVTRVNQFGLALERIRGIATGIRQQMADSAFIGPMPLPGQPGPAPAYGPPIEGDAWLRHVNQGRGRPHPISEQLAQAMSFLREMGIVMEVFSGGQDPHNRPEGAGPRHDHGNAADVMFYRNGRQLNWQNQEDIPTYQEIVRRARAAGVTGFGAGPGYMTPGSMHIGYGEPAVWGRSRRSDTAPTWLVEAFSGVAPAVSAAVQEGMVGNVGQRQVGINETLGTAAVVNADNRVLQGEVAYLRAARELAAVISAQVTGTDDDRLGTHERRILESIEKGDFRGVTAEQVERLLEDARRADANVERIRARGRDRNTLESNTEQLESQRREIEQRRLDSLGRARDPNYRARSTELTRLLELEREQLAIAERLFGLNSDEYRDEAARMAQQRSLLVGAEAAEAMAELADAARDSERQAISEQRILRQREFEERLAELAALRDRAIADGALVADANMLYERAVAAERARLREENKTQLQQTLDEMAKFAENINRSSADWAKGLSNALYESFSDKDAFRNLGNTIRESIARSLTDAAAAAILRPFESLIAGDGSPGSGIGGMFERLIGNLMGTFSQTVQNAAGTMMQSAGGASGGGFVGLMSKVLGKGKGAAVAHTGGIAGSRSLMTRNTAAANFLGAPRFHTGGIVGPAGRKFTGLAPSEVPIIAQRGEGVFTQEQMKHMGGSINNRSISINAPVTVNASGGTPEQNADLARQMSEQMERTMRGVVNQEMIRQMRPGGILR
jgi:tape measure domain-containing protein